ncbi:MAG: hypothetical protein ACREJ9_14545 [Candidatus Rokuibacteriota bacterium]
MLLTFLRAVASGPGLPDEVQAYEEALARLRAGAGVTLEEVFIAGARAAEALLNPDPPGGATLLETLDAAGVGAAAARMPGFVLQRAETIMAAPDPEFFRVLARAHGDDADRRFFEAYRRTFSLPGQRAWARRLGAGERCTRYGRRTLVELYRQWSDHRRLHPDRYASQVAAFLQDIEAELLTGTCACGSRADVVRELRGFVDSFPDATVTGAVRARLRQLEGGGGNVRPACRAA